MVQIDDPVTSISKAVWSILGTVFSSGVLLLLFLLLAWAIKLLWGLVF